MIALTSRALAALLAGFLLLNAAAGLFAPTFSAGTWILDLRWLPPAAAAALTALLAAPVIAGLFTPRRSFALAATAAASAISLVASIDAGRFWLLLSRGSIRTDMPIPASLIYALLMAAGAWAFAQTQIPLSWPRRTIAAGVAAALASLFPVLQMVCFGLTDYRRPADAVLVLGARTYADGTPSDALSDRVRAACDLYHQGLAQRLIMSGGPGDGATDEPTAMARLAQELGVSRESIILDRAGLNTRASITNTAAICRDQRLSRVLAVSHFYHLPRIKLEASRADLDLCTVPAPQGYPLRKLPWFVARETAAWWAYWARGSTALCTP